MIALLLALVAMLLCLLGQVATVLLAARYFASAARKPLRWGAWRDGFIRISIVMTLLMIGVVVQIGIWAGLYGVLDLFDDLETALYFSGVTYTSLGYGDIVLPRAARLLAPLEAATGLLMFGITTAVLIAAMQYGIKDGTKRPDRQVNPKR